MVLTLDQHPPRHIAMNPAERQLESMPEERQVGSVDSMLGIQGGLSNKGRSETGRNLSPLLFPKYPAVMMIFLPPLLVL